MTADLESLSHKAKKEMFQGTAVTCVLPELTRFLKHHVQNVFSFSG